MGFRNYTATIIMVAILLGLQACAPVYIPNARHSHLLDEKGEVSSSVKLGNNGIDVQTAYAISENLGIAGAASFSTYQEEGDTNYHKHSYGELAIEYFKPIGSIGRLEVIGGGGLGSATSVDNYKFSGSNRQIQATGSFNKFFLQSNIGLETNWVETGLALRLGYVTFNKFETTSTTYGDSETGRFFEPALFARLGWENIKVEGQIGTATPIIKAGEEYVAFDYQPLLITFGLHFNL